MHGVIVVRVQLALQLVAMMGSAKMRCLLPMVQKLLVCALCSLVLTFSGIGVSVAADSYPNRGIRIVMPYPPGGGGDTIGRPIAKKMSDLLGQSVVIDNRGGAGGNIGMEFAARSAPDGYTLVMGLTAQLAVNQSLFKNTGYDPVADFEPISLIANGAYLLVAHPSLPIKTIKDLVDIATKRPNQILYASSGNGSGAHLATELMKTMTGIKLVHVPYKGGGPALVDTISGQAQLLFATPVAAGGHLRSGRVRGIAVSTSKRVLSFPDIPTVAESGLKGYDSGVWYGLLTPKGTPSAIVGRLNSELKKTLTDTSVSSFLSQNGIDAIGSSPEVLTQYMKSEMTKWKEVIKAANIKID